MVSHTNNTVLSLESTVLFETNLLKMWTIEPSYQEGEHMFLKKWHRLVSELDPLCVGMTFNKENSLFMHKSRSNGGLN